MTDGTDEEATMQCRACREVISAALDGEASADGLRRAGAHLDGCADCRAFRRDARRMHRRMRVGPAAQVPDLTASILSAVDAGRAGSPSRRRTRSSGLRRVRAALAAVGVAQLIVSLPVLAGLVGSGSPHVARELGAFGGALGLGFVTVAWQPARAAGLLPMAAALGVLLCGGALLDLLAGHTGLLVESSHLLQLAGLGILWSLARAVGSPEPAAAAA